MDISNWVPRALSWFVGAISLFVFAGVFTALVTLLPTLDASGSSCTASAGNDNMSLHIQDVHTTDNIAAKLTISAAHTALAVDDFNLDGFEDLFIISSEEAVVATAEDTANHPKEVPI